MSSTSARVIVFGASGAVGRAAAQEAQSRGAEVILAMRDTKKPIPGLTSETEIDGNFTRIQADLTNPDSIERAVAQSRATIAFTYTPHAAPEGLSTTFTAMKKGGISHVVLLSSYTIYEFGDAKGALNGTNMIATLHARAELALAETGLVYTALRPMYFASNIKLLEDWKNIKQGRLDLAFPEAPFDYLAPEDIGTVAGAVLVAPPPSSGAHLLPLCGPELLPQRKAWKLVGEGIGIDIAIHEIDEEGLRKKFSAKGWPEPLVEANVVYVVNNARDPTYLYPTKRYKEASTNFEKYTGKKQTKFGEWVRRHKDELLS